MKPAKTRKRRVGRPPKLPEDRAIGLKLWINGAEARQLHAVLKARRPHRTPQEYILVVLRNDLARAAAGQPSGPVTSKELFAVVRATLDLAEAAAKGGAR